MISIKEAKLIILEHSRKVPVQPIPLAMALGSTLAEDVYARGGGSDCTARPLEVYSKGFELTFDSIGLLAGLGHKQVEVYRQPTVGIIVTGRDPLQSKEFKLGQVRDSNSYALTAALKQARITKINFYNGGDDLNSMTAILSEALQHNDVLILTCGAGAGCYDFVLKAADGAGITQIFNKVRQKPGKPLYFGKTDQQLIFGLPGNSSLILDYFYQYVLPSIVKLNNYKDALKRKN